VNTILFTQSRQAAKEEKFFPYREGTRYTLNGVSFPRLEPKPRRKILNNPLLVSPEHH
jgi:hypothetical protein